MNDLSSIPKNQPFHSSATFRIKWDLESEYLMKFWNQPILRKSWFVLLSWLVFAVFLATVLPWVSSATREAGLLESIDTNFSFDPVHLYDIVESYGPSGRIFYVIQRWTFDVIWPLVYAAPLFLTLNVFARLPWQGKLLGLRFLPFFAQALDYLENIAFTLVVLLYPSVLLPLAWLGVILSVLKWTALGSSMALAMVSPIVWSFFKFFPAKKS